MKSTPSHSKTFHRSDPPGPSHVANFQVHCVLLTDVLAHESIDLIPCAHFSHIIESFSHVTGAKNNCGIFKPCWNMEVHQLPCNECHFARIVLLVDLDNSFPVCLASQTGQKTYSAQEGLWGVWASRANSGLFDICACRCRGGRGTGRTSIRGQEIDQTLGGWRFDQATGGACISSWPQDFHVKSEHQQKDLLEPRPGLCCLQDQMTERRWSQTSTNDSYTYTRLN